MKEKKMTYSVGEMAEYFGVSRDTLRLYDKMGIISPIKNEDNGYRVYSRADFICLDYVMRLKSLGMPLDDIKMMLNNCTIEKAAAIMQMQDKLIDEKIHELKSLQAMVKDYRKSFSNAIMHMGHITVEESPKIIYKDIGTSMKGAMAAFNMISRENVPKLTFVFSKENFYKFETSFSTPETRNSRQDYALTLIDDEGLSQQEGFPSEEFEILEPAKCVHAVVKFYTNKDYSELDRVRSFIAENGYRVTGRVLNRMLSARNNKDLNVDYYDLWAPIE